MKHFTPRAKQRAFASLHKLIRKFKVSFSGIAAQAAGKLLTDTTTQFRDTVNIHFGSNQLRKDLKGLLLSKQGQKTQTYSYPAGTKMASLPCQREEI